MKSYKEMAEEAIRRRDSYLKLRLEKIKKMCIVKRI